MRIHFLLLSICICLLLSSCASKNQYLLDLQSELDVANTTASNYAEKINNLENTIQQLRTDKERAERDKESFKVKYESCDSELQQSKTMINSLNASLATANSTISSVSKQAENLTDNQSAISESLRSSTEILRKKEDVLARLQIARSFKDSVTTVIAANLTKSLKDGINDDDIQIEVDKTVVFINLTDKMMFQSGSSNLSPRANTVLGKIAIIVKEKPDFEVMVEGYTDNVPISNSCMQDNWDLSVKRSTSVVRTLQKNYGVNPDRLIAAGRGEFNKLADNASEAGRSVNRRTRIIILPKVDQFYDLLDPDNFSE